MAAGRHVFVQTRAFGKKLSGNGPHRVTQLEIVCGDDAIDRVAKQRDITGRVRKEPMHSETHMSLEDRRFRRQMPTKLEDLEGIRLRIFKILDGARWMLTTNDRP